MTKQQSTLGGVIAAGYLLLAVAAASPLLQAGYVGHGNGLSFLLATALTSPLSVILLLLNDLVSHANAFHMTGWPYVITLAELGAGALLNARLLYLLVAFISRRKRATGVH